jgi:thioredoxin reductase (NADPH)
MGDISGAEPEAVIIGAGPAGLWAAFQLGLHGVGSILIDSAGQPGGQCTALYADKPVYDLPGFPAIDAGRIGENLAGQIARFRPDYRLSERVTAIAPTDLGFAIALQAGPVLHVRHAIIATGLGPLGVSGRQPALELPDGVETDGGHFKVTPGDFQTGQRGLYAIGDAATYPGKLCLLVSAFHEAALMAFAIRTDRAGGRRPVVGYSSTASALKAKFT